MKKAGMKGEGRRAKSRKSSPAGPPPAAPPGKGKGKRNRKLDYVAAARKLAKGGTMASVARAAGSNATTRKGLRAVGTQIANRIRTRVDIHDRFDRLGFSIDTFAEGVIDAAQNASRRVKIGEAEDGTPHFAFDPDYDARTRARNQYLEACGLRQLPREGGEEPPASVNVGDELLQKVADGTASEKELAEFLGAAGGQ